MSGVKGMIHRRWLKKIKIEVINKHLIDKVPKRQLAKEYGIDIEVLVFISLFKEIFF